MSLKLDFNENVATMEGPFQATYYPTQEQIADLTG